MSDERSKATVGRLVYDPEAKVHRVADPWSQNTQWPDVRVDSTSFNGLPAHQQLFEMSIGYLRAAVALCRHAGEAGEHLQWPDAAAAYFCLHHATELFLKACLQFRDARGTPRVHEVADLFDRYESCFPDERFTFPTPWHISAEEINKVLGDQVVGGVDAIPDQLFRYGRSTGGQVSAGVQYFSPGYMFNYLQYLGDRWREIWRLLNAGAGS